MRFEPITKQPANNKVLRLKMSERGPPTKTANEKPNWRRAVNVPACISVRLKVERIEGSEVPRKVLDIPKKLIEIKAPIVIIYRFLII